MIMTLLFVGFARLNRDKRTLYKSLVCFWLKSMLATWPILLVFVLIQYPVLDSRQKHTSNFESEIVDEAMGPRAILGTIA